MHKRLVTLPGTRLAGCSRLPQALTLTQTLTLTSNPNPNPNPRPNSPGGIRSPSTSSTRSPTRSSPSSAAGPRSAVTRLTSPKPDAASLTTTPKPLGPRRVTTRRSGSTPARPGSTPARPGSTSRRPPSGELEAKADRSACSSTWRSRRRRLPMRRANAT